MRDEITEKSWFWDDDELQEFEEDEYWVWTTTSDSITYVQIQRAFRDPDVEICDIRASGGSPSIILHYLPYSPEDNWPVVARDQLDTMAQQQFRINDHKPGWRNTSNILLLQRAEDNIQQAQSRIGNDENDIGMQINLADALNYLLFVFDNIEQGE